MLVDFHEIRHALHVKGGDPSRRSNKNEMIGRIDGTRREPEPGSQVENGNDQTADVDEAFDNGRRTGERCYRDGSDYLDDVVREDAVPGA
jgi:hypothetical protein